MGLKTLRTLFLSDFCRVVKGIEIHEEFLKSTNQNQLDSQYGIKCVKKVFLLWRLKNRCPC